MTIEEAKNTTVYFLEPVDYRHYTKKIGNKEFTDSKPTRFEIESCSYYDFVTEQAEETTSPRGVEGKLFVEEQSYQTTIEDPEADVLEFHRDIYFEDEGRRPTVDDCTDLGDGLYDLTCYILGHWGLDGKRLILADYKNPEAAHQEWFDRIEKYDVDELYYSSFKEAYENQIEVMGNIWGTDEHVTRHILEKEQLVEYERNERKIEAQEKERERVESLSEEYAKMIEPKKEKYKETCRRLSQAIGEKIEKKVFHAAVKKIRAKL